MLVPPLKTQGIKTRLAAFVLESIRWDGRGRWIEPFLGSGAMLFNAAPERALVADANPHVIAFHRALQDGAVDARTVEERLIEEGARLRERGESHYYAVRERFNATHDPLDLLFLSRSCFNGVMRFNRRGGFNVPFCRKPERFRRHLVTKIVNQVRAAARVMQGRDWQFIVQDWRETLAAARGQDFVYSDPPYVGRHSDFYSRWSEEEAVALAEATKKLPCGSATSLWYRNRHRENHHIEEHWGWARLRTKAHFYHVGSRESLRGPIEEGLLVGDGG